MINKGKHPILGINVHAVDYEFAVDTVVKAAEERRPFILTATAVHGIMVGFLDRTHGRRLNGFDMVVPCGQPVRWALNWLHGNELSDRVYGPNLTLHAAKAFAAKGIRTYLYGSTPEVVEKFSEKMKERFPGLDICGYEPSRFRRLTEAERMGVVERIKNSGAQVVLLGLGTPLQEVFAFEYKELLGIPIMCIGATFQFHAGTLVQAPQFMQARGIEWVFRLAVEPTRLWKRYLVLSPMYLWGLFLQKCHLRSRVPRFPDGTEPRESYG